MPPKPKFPLTDLICDMLHATPERLRKMDIAKTAKHYGLTEQLVREYRDMQLGSPVKTDLFGDAA